MRKIISTRQEIKNFIKTIKKQIQKEKDNKKRIAFILALFVLEFSILEHYLKLLSMNLTGRKLKGKQKSYDEYMNKATFGSALEGIKQNCCDMDGPTKKFFTLDYKCSFIEACKNINNLRNDFYHNIYKGYGKKEREISFRKLLNNIEKRIEKRIQVRFTENENQKNSVHCPLIENGKLPDDWTIEMLIEITKKYINELLEVSKKIIPKTKIQPNEKK